MKTAVERESAFRKDLDDLLTKHGAVLDITDDGEDCGFGVSGIAVITMYSTWDINGDQTADFAEFRI